MPMATTHRNKGERERERERDMRIAPNIVVQSIDEDEVVIVEEKSNQEIIINDENAKGLMTALMYFFPEIDIVELRTELTKKLVQLGARITTHLG